MQRYHKVKISCFIWFNLYYSWRCQL